MIHVPKHFRIIWVTPGNAVTRPLDALYITVSKPPPLASPQDLSGIPTRLLGEEGKPTPLTLPPKLDTLYILSSQPDTQRETTAASPSARPSFPKLHPLAQERRTDGVGRGV